MLIRHDIIFVLGIEWLVFGRDKYFFRRETRTAVEFLARCRDEKMSGRNMTSKRLKGRAEE